VPVERIKELESVLTIVGGKVVYASGPFARLDPPPLPALPDWLPLRHYDGYYKPQAAMMQPRAHRHPLIIGEQGPWSMECPCGAF
jgi:hypothetical protein